MKAIQLSSVLAMLLLIAACVTINVYFPSAEAARAADQIIRDVYGESEASPNTTPQPEPTGLAPVGRQPVWVSLLVWSVQPAQAAANINIETPAIRSIRASMEKRFPKLEPFYENGSVGMTNNGLIAVRDLNLIALKDRKKASGLVAEENRDRKTLYREIARANGHPEWEADIRATFASRWISNAPAGWWYQNDGGDWQRK
jgi:uncharacterized protein YdbL (DUF1318 family)